MSWQDDLRGLDEELAAGRISADDYRVRRDQVLSSAVALGSQPSPEGEATQVPISPPTPPPAPQAQQQLPPHGDGGDADKTQVVPGQTVSDGDRTQAVGGWLTQRPGEVERTQIVPGLPPQMMAGGQRPRPAPPPGGFPQQPGWQPHEEQFSPPWGGSDFPPLAATGTPDWVRQGPELFENGGHSRAGRIVAIVATIVVLAAIAFGAYWIWGRGDNQAGPGNSPSTTAPPSTTTSKKPPDPLPTADLPGKVTVNEAVKTFADVPSQNYLTQPEINAYRASKAGMTKLTLSDVDGNRLVVMLVKLPDTASARTAATALNQVQIVNGMKASNSGPPNVLMVEYEPKGDQNGLLRAHYVHGDILVRLDLAGKSMSRALTTFNDVLASQLEVLPADG